ncbi:MAG: polysaccharide deacetylase family protein [Bacteroidota bacterium]
MNKSPKLKIQAAIRGVHRAVLYRPMPRRVAVYLHTLETDQYPAFERLVRWFQEQAYQFVGPDAFLHSNQAGERLFFLSFDDNYVTWHRALPLLERLGVQATFYANTCCFREDLTEAAMQAFYQRIRFRGRTKVSLTRSELVALRRAGHTIGAHTHTHPVLSALPLEQAQHEIALNKQLLEELLGEPVSHFAFPYGFERHFSPALADYCHALGFRSIAYATPALQHATPSPRRLHRSLWPFYRSFERNLEDLRIDGRLFTRLTGRSAVG